MNNPMKKEINLSSKTLFLSQDDIKINLEVKFFFRMKLVSDITEVPMSYFCMFLLIHFLRLHRLNLHTDHTIYHEMKKKKEALVWFISKLKPQTAIDCQLSQWLPKTRMKLKWLEISKIKMLTLYYSNLWN